MTIKKLKEIINSLAKSQGSYGRLARGLDEANGWKNLSDYCKQNKIKDAVGLVTALEC